LGALLTRKQVEEAKLGKVGEEEAPTLPPVVEPPKERVRMHHPDSTDRHPIRDCEFELEGQVIKLRRGVALVTPDVAKVLESMSWRRGKTVKQEFDE